MNTQTLSNSEQENLYKNYFREAGKLLKQAMEQKARAGDIPGCAPVGYKNVTKDGQKLIEKDEFKAPIVQVAFRLSGDGNMSLRAILKLVTDLGLTSRNGKKLGPAALWGILTNPFYAGKIRYNGIVRNGNHEPLIDEELFQKVHENLSHRCKSK